MMTLDEIQDKIRQEIRTIKSSNQQGNPGKARVCGRRAAGFGLQFWYEQVYAESANLSAVTALKTLANNETIDTEVRAAAERLITSVSQKSGQSISQNPLQDARIIIQFVETQIEAPLWPDQA